MGVFLLLLGLGGEGDGTGRVGEEGGYVGLLVGEGGVEAGFF